MVSLTNVHRETWNRVGWFSYFTTILHKTSPLELSHKITCGPTLCVLGLVMTCSYASSGFIDIMFSNNMLIFFVLSHPVGLQCRNRAVWKKPLAWENTVQTRRRKRNCMILNSTLCDTVTPFYILKMCIKLSCLMVCFLFFSSSKHRQKMGMWRRY